MTSWPQEHVVVTAGAGGIGLVTARRFIDAGAKVSVCDLAERAIAGFQKEYPSHFAARANVGHSDEMEAFFGEVVAANGPVTVLVNNAGIAGPRGPVETLDYDEWNHNLQVSLSGMFYCVKQVVPAMKKMGRGVIINMNTGSTRTGLPNRTAYITAKAAVTGLTQNLARELGPSGIRCNEVLPGAVNGPRIEKIIHNVAAERGVTFEQARADMLTYISMRTMVEPEDIAAMIFFLASSEARFVSGQSIGVCGNAEWEE